MGKKRSTRLKISDSEDTIPAEESQSQPKKFVDINNETETRKNGNVQKESGASMSTVAQSTDETSAAGTSPMQIKNTSAAYTVSITKYAYDQTEEVLKVIIKLPGIQNHPKEKISLKVTEFSLKFLVKEMDGRNWSLAVPQLAHAINSKDARFYVKKDKVVLELPKSLHFKWTSLTPSDVSLKLEWTHSMLFFFMSLTSFPEHFMKTVDNLWSECYLLVNIKKINLLNPCENDKLIGCFPPSGQKWRTLDEVINYAKRKVRDELENKKNVLLYGMAVMEKLNQRSQRTEELRNDQNAEETGQNHICTVRLKKNEPEFKSNEVEVMKNEIKDMKSKKKYNEGKSEFSYSEMPFRLEGKNLKKKCEKNVSERLADCLEEIANDNFKLKKYECCAETLTEIIELFPDRSNPFSNRAVCYLKLGRYQESLQDGQMAVHLNRSNVDGWLCIGECQLAFGNANECLEELVKVSAETSDQNLKKLILKLTKFSTILEKAIKAFDENDLDPLLSLYEAASAMAVQSQSLKQKVVECKILSGKFNKADDEADILLKEKVTESDSYYFKGMSHYYQDQKDESFENFDICLSKDEGHVNCKELYQRARDLYFWKERGNDNYKKKKYDLAIKSYLKGLDIDARNKAVNATINFNLCIAHMQIQKVADAVKYINNAISLNSKYVKALLKRAEIYLEVQQIQDAVNDLQVVCKISPSPSNKKLLEEAKTRLKSAPKPQKNFTSLKEEEQNKILAESKKEKGNNFFENLHYEKAIKLYSEAIILDPNCPIHYSNRSACQMMLKKYQEAMIDALKSLELDSSFVKGYLRKGRIELALGKGNEALETLKQGLKLDSNNGSLREERNKATKLIKCISKANECFESKNFVEASRWYSDAAVIASNCSEIMVCKLESLLYCDKHYEVIRLLEGQEKDSNFYYVTALLDYLHCDKEKALTNAGKAVDLNSNNSKAKTLRSIVDVVTFNWDEGLKAKEASSFQKAQKYLEKASNIDPYNKTLKAQILCDLGDCCVLQEDFEKALQQFTVAIESKGDMVRPYLERAKCYDRLGHLEESVKDFEQAYKLLPVPINKKLLDDAKLKLKKSKKKDYYKVLGLNSKASMDDIRKSYKKLAKEHHPDRHMTDSDKEKGEIKFKEINEAYSTLIDSLKRERYDRGDDIEDDCNPFANFFFRPSPFGFNPFYPFSGGFFHRRSPSPDQFYHYSSDYNNYSD